MLATLFESQPRRTRGRKGLVLSAAMHAIVVGGLVNVTMHRAMPKPNEGGRRDGVIFTEPPRAHPPRPRGPTGPSGPLSAPSPHVDLPTIDIGNIPPVSGPSTVVQQPDGGWWPRNDDSVVSTGVDNGAPHTALTVDRVAAPLNGAPQPDYPDMYQRAGIEGTVRVQFIVDSLGRPDMSQFRVVFADLKAFADAVRDAVARTRYRPAEFAGHSVAQRVEQEFTFRIAR